MLPTGRIAPSISIRSVSARPTEKLYVPPAPVVVSWIRMSLASS